MTTFERKSVHAAVLAGLGVLATAFPAEAVHVDPKGRGSVLIFPYFTVRADGGGNSTAYHDSYVSIVNTTATAKAVKVHFYEGKRGAQVLGFNLFLSPHDVWTGLIARTAEGAALVSGDNSCVVPNALFTNRNPATIGAGDLNHFKNLAYAGPPLDGGGTSLDRTREGHLQVLEMGEIIDATAIAAAKHNPAGVPANCAYFEANDATLVTALAAPAGGLMGSLSLINVLAGTDYSLDAVALANWHTVTPIYSRQGDAMPNLAVGNVVTSSVFTDAGNVVTSTWASSSDAVSAALMRESLMNEWMLELATASGTDWIITFPTKPAYSQVGTGAATPPFNANFNGGWSCDPFSFSIWNREEGTTAIVGESALCHEANVLTFANSNMLGSNNVLYIDPTALGRAGWGAIRFDRPVQVLTPLSSTVNGAAAPPQAHRGLPAVGFAMQDFNNGIVGGVLSNYGGQFPHKYQHSIGSTP